MTLQWFGSVVYGCLFWFLLIQGSAVQLSNRNPYFYRFWCHQPLITQLLSWKVSYEYLHYSHALLNETGFNYYLICSKQNNDKNNIKGLLVWKTPISEKRREGMTNLKRWKNVNYGSSYIYPSSHCTMYCQEWCADWRSLVKKSSLF